MDGFLLLWDFPSLVRSSIASLTLIVSALLSQILGWPELPVSAAQWRKDEEDSGDTLTKMA